MKPDIDIECPNCGYDQRGLPAVHCCPECGLRFGPGAMVWRQPTEKWGMRAARITLLAIFVIVWFYRVSLAQAFWGTPMAGRAMSISSAAFAALGTIAFLLIIIREWFAGSKRAFVVLTDLEVTLHHRHVERRVIPLCEIASIETRQVGRRTFLSLRTRDAFQLDFSAALGLRASQFQAEIEKRLARLQPPQDVLNRSSVSPKCVESLPRGVGYTMAGEQ